MKTYFKIILSSQIIKFLNIFFYSVFVFNFLHNKMSTGSANNDLNLGQVKLFIKLLFDWSSKGIDKTRKVFLLVINLIKLFKILILRKNTN